MDEGQAIKRCGSHQALTVKPVAAKAGSVRVSLSGNPRVLACKGFYFRAYGSRLLCGLKLWFPTTGLLVLADHAAES